jgi:hypothetical protein
MDPIHPPAVVRAAADLRILAAEINAAHKSGEESTRRGLAHFRVAGEALLKAKEAVGHGGFKAWVEKHVHCSYRTAACYMRVAREWAKCAAAAHLRDALRMLTEDAAASDDEPPASSEPDASAQGTPDGTAGEHEQDPGAGGGQDGAAQAEPPGPPIPDRIKPYFESASLHDQVARKAVEFGNLLRQYEEAPSYKKAVENKKHTQYSNAAFAAGRAAKLYKPVQPCPQGCGAVEPSLDRDPCPACQGKGYQTADDIDNAEAAT